MGGRSRDATARPGQGGGADDRGDHGCGRRRRRCPTRRRHLPSGGAGNHRRTHRPGPPGPALRPGLMGSRSIKPTFGPAQAADDPRASALFRQTALTDLARTALLGTPQRPLLEKAARLVQCALNAETCGIYEYLPGGHDLLLRAGAFAPGQRRGLTTVDLTGSTVVSPNDPEGSSPLSAALVVPIGVSPPPFGCLAVRARWDSGFDDDDRQFAVLAAGILSAAVERLLADEGQRLALFQDPLTGLPNRALILDHLRLA